jgi:hypothetical protein
VEFLQVEKVGGLNVPLPIAPQMKAENKKDGWVVKNKAKC